MKKIKALFVLSAFAMLFSINVDAQSYQSEGFKRAEGLAKAALSDCIAEARAAGNDILISVFKVEGEDSYTVQFCASRRDISFTPQNVGSVTIVDCQVVSTNCQFPAPTDNPCPRGPRG